MSITRVLCLALLSSLFAGCATHLPQHELPSSHVLPADESSPLVRYVNDRLVDPNDWSAFNPLYEGNDALAARLYLIDQARYGIDLQTYIYADDTTGKLVAAHLLQAADRGVRVRLLIDDIGNSLSDTDLGSLDWHPNIDVRLFNPLQLRHLRMLSKVFEFGRINYRMHNKLLLVDGVAMITGGRNVGDEYYALSPMDFQDIDIIGLGPIAQEAGASFDLFWNHDLAQPVSKILPRSNDQALAALREQLLAARREAAQGTLMEAVAGSSFIQAFQDGRLAWYNGPATWLYDPPAKADAHSDLAGEPFLSRSLARHTGEIEHELLIMSAYLVPGERGQVALTHLLDRGVRVAVLTNSLASTDVLAVHSGYAPYRKPLLAAGMELWELRPLAAQNERVNAFVSDSLASLHAKKFIFDRHTVFIGSLNLDPRSVSLNTEAGVLIEHPGMAEYMGSLFERWTDNDYAWQVVLDEQGDLQWLADDVAWQREPGTGVARRLITWMIGWLPIESQL
ncbi:phospholipase D family protein [Halopseudomonas salegens]|uniref:Putative cardiolipin synthase n=1 Tax=Halopseudomonas salegens TaxID=1434072 RepID=A0A1H2FB05_9GAMM|nr:phospholipase D family protein [Halopseudomonas salegens]SDU04576.1 putative cardiolipin synthase [Halopseudomonas salegens]